MSSQSDELFREHHDQEEHWVSVSDLMAGLMMIFLLVAIVYMIKVGDESRKMHEVAQTYDSIRNELYRDLEAEFKDDLKGWGAELKKDLTIRFNEPEVLFDSGEDRIKLKFRYILDDFFPRYVSIVSSDKYRDNITEVRIEGHTSSYWKGSNTADAYFENMKLSQSRTRSVLQYALSNKQVVSVSGWLRKHVTANGLSSSKLIMHSDGSEDSARSRRVEFRIKTDADKRIAEILQVRGAK